MKFNVSIFRTQFINLTLEKLDAPFYRHEYHEGHLCAVQRSFFECGIDERTVYRVRYLRIGTFAVKLFTRSMHYEPFWAKIDSRYNNVIPIKGKKKTWEKK